MKRIQLYSKRPLMRDMIGYVFMSMGRRKATSFFCILVISVAVIVLFVFSFFAENQRQAARDALDDGWVTKIIAICRKDSRFDDSYRFNEKVVGKIKQIPGVKEAYPCIENAVYLGLDDGNLNYSWAEGIIINDPGITKSQLLWGRGISSNSANEIVLSQPLFNDIVGDRDFDWSEKKFILTVSRNKDSKSEQLRKELALVGVVKSNSKRVYLPLEQLQSIDMWLSGMVQSSSGSDIEDISQFSFASGRVFIEAKDEDIALGRMTDHYGLTAKKMFEYQETLVDEDGFRMVLLDSESMILSLMTELPISIKMVRMKAVSLEVKGTGDWQQILICAPYDNDKLSDLVGSENSHLFSEISGFKALISGNGRDNLYPGKDAPFKIFLNTDIFPTEIQIPAVMDLGNWSQMIPLWTTEKNLREIMSSLQLKSICLVTTSDKTVIEAFKMFSYASMIPEGEITIIDEHNLSDGPSQFKAEKPLWDLPEIRIPKKDAPQKLIIIQGLKESLTPLLKGFKEDSYKLVEIREIKSIRRHYPGRNFSLLAATTNEISDLKVSWGNDFADLNDSEGLASLYFSGNHILLGSRKISLKKVSGFPDNTVLVNSKSLTKNEVMILARPIDLKEKLDLTSDGYMLIAQDSDSFEKCLEIMKSKKLEPVILNFPEKKKVVCYEVQDKQEGKFDSYLQAILRDDYSFLSVFPNFQVTAFFDNNSLDSTFIGSAENDLLKNHYTLLSGNWLSGDPEEVLIPMSAVPDVYQADLSSLIGQKFNLKFKRLARRSVAEPDLLYPCQVVGVVEGDFGFLPIESVKNFHLWKEGRIEYDLKKSDFYSPINNYFREGHGICKIFAHSALEVKALVDHLEKSLGYDTENSLLMRENYESLVRGLVFLVALIFSGTIFSGMITVAITSLLNTKTKIHEIGILRAHGATRFTVTKLFLIEGIIIGSIAFLLAMIITPEVINLVATTLKKIGQGGLNICADDFWSFQFIWLYLIGFVISVFFSLLGVLAAAIWAGRTSIVEALSSKG